jgi:hypothetical protein
MFLRNQFISWGYQKDVVTAMLQAASVDHSSQSLAYNQISIFDYIEKFT